MKAASALQNPTNGDSHSKTPKSKQNNSENKKGENKSEIEKEGSFLLGEPTFTEIPGAAGRWRCVETGQEMPEKEKKAYSKSKACRIGLINAFVAKKMPPLNAFEPHPTNKRQLICKITGDTVNKSEEHIWKHLNGIRFNNKLAQIELEAMNPPDENEEEEKKAQEEKKKKKNPVNKKLRELEANAIVNGVNEEAEKEEKEIGDLVKKSMNKETEAINGGKKNKGEKEKNKKKMKIEADVNGVEGEKEGKKVKGEKKKNKKMKREKEESDDVEREYWRPPVGERWDDDDGKDRWGSDDSTDLDADGTVDSAEDGDGKASPEKSELVTRTKRLSIDSEPTTASKKKKMKKAPESAGPTSVASKKKKNKKASASKN